MKTINLRCFNINTALKILLLLGFSFFFLQTLFTGSVSLYVHPRINPYMIFASAVMIAIAFLLLGDLFKPHEKKANSWPLLFFIIPLIMAYALPAQSFNSSTGTVGEIQLSGGERTSSNNKESSKQSELTNKSAESAAAIAGSENKDIAASKVFEEGLTLQNGVIVMENRNFYNWINEIYTDIDKYVGTPIEVIGFVFNDNEAFGENEFVPARLMMVCCAADMVPVGFLCRYDNASKLETDSWVKVTGTIEKTMFDGETIPYIKAKSIETSDKPAEDYVYPY